MWGCYYLIEFIDHIAGEGKQGRYKLTREDGSIENVTLELNDGATVEGTPINRENLMAMQGFVANTIIFNSDGSITETNSLGQTLTTVFNADGSVTETLSGEKTISLTTTFNSDGSISEVLS